MFAECVCVVMLLAVDQIIYGLCLGVGEVYEDKVQVKHFKVKLKLNIGLQRSMCIIASIPLQYS